jgi:CRP-like cAMP-binding protein
MNPELSSYLQRLPLFHNVPASVVATVADKLTVRTLAKGEVLVRQGEISNSFFIIRMGWVKIVTTGAKGEEVVLNQVGPGQIIGEMGVIDQNLRSATIVAISLATVLEIGREVFIEVLNQYPLLALTLARSMAERLRFANNYTEKAIEWSQHIIEGDYNFVLQEVQIEQATIVDPNQSLAAKASAFLSTFFKMVKNVKEREDNLKQQMQQLTIQIDEVKRQKAVKELTENTFFGNLQQTAYKLRQERVAKEQNLLKQVVR